MQNLIYTGNSRLIVRSPLFNVFQSNDACHFSFRFKVVISSLFHAIPGIANVLLVCVVFWLIFSIMGVNLFGGKFYKCVDARGVKYDATVVANKTACLERGDRWITSNVNFDNSFNGFLALLQVVRLLELLTS